MSSRDFTKEKNTKCISCNKYILRVPGQKKVIGDEIEANIASNVFNKNIIVGDALCNICRRYLFRSQDSEATSLQNVGSPLNLNATVTSVPSSSLIQQMQHMSFESASSSASSSSSMKDPSFKVIGNPQWAEETVELELPRVASSHGYCFICGSKTNIVTVPFEARKQIYSEKKIFVPKGNRCCSHHLMGNYLYTDDFENLNANIVSNTSVIEVKDIKSFLEHSSNQSIISQISNMTFPEKKLQVLVGLNWCNIKEIAQMMTSLDKTHVIEALCVFLFKLRTGNSNEVVAAVFGVNSSKVSVYCNKMLQAFENYILPTQFGFGTVDREHLIQNETSDIAKKLHGTNNELILIFDGTYIHHEKSQNNEYQRRSYSGQKKKPLCKPFTITTTNGFIVETLGPYAAKYNDAQIMEHVLKEPNGLCTLMKPNDICVVDRGFRDVKQYLEAQGYRVLMPALKGNRKQLTTQEANDSRMVTKIRWVIEAIHGIIGRKYKLLHNQFDNKLLPNIKSYCRIASYLNNKFGKRLKSDDVLQGEILQQMFALHSVENTLAIEVENNRWNRRQARFNVLSSQDLLDFTRMSVEELKVFFCGTYQLKQAISYLAEIMDDNYNIQVRYLKESNYIIRAEVKSRHINKKVYKCYIQYIPNSTGYRGIERHCCECANGNRTIGCCSHVAAIIYYLSKARFQSKMVRPAEILSKLFILDELTPIINEDSDDD